MIVVKKRPDARQSHRRREMEMEYVPIRDLVGIAGIARTDAQSSKSRLKIAPRAAMLALAVICTVLAQKDLDLISYTNDVAPRAPLAGVGQLVAFPFVAS